MQRTPQRPSPPAPPPPPSGIVPFAARVQRRPHPASPASSSKAPHGRSKASKLPPTAARAGLTKAAAVVDASSSSSAVAAATLPAAKTTTEACSTLAGQPSSSWAASKPTASGGEKEEYFNSFRRSFYPRTAAVAATPGAGVGVVASHYADLLHDLALWEQELRLQLTRHEAEEVTQIAHAVEKVLLPLIPALRDVSPLDLTQQEQVARWSICDDYYDVLLEATQLQEMLHRRHLCRHAEPQQRTRITDGEVPHWIEARRLQVMRENQESATAQNAEQVERLAHFKHIQQQLYQVFLLEESERADRMEVERLQRLHVGGLAEVIAKEYRRVRLCQLRYEAARHPLCPALSYEIAAEEGLHRSMLAQEQVHAFKSVQAAEVRGYLANVR